VTSRICEKNKSLAIIFLFHNFGGHFEQYDNYIIIKIMKQIQRIKDIAVFSSYQEGRVGIPLMGVKPRNITMPVTNQNLDF
jgi:hypothetical protein